LAPAWAGQTYFIGLVGGDICLVAALFMVLMAVSIGAYSTIVKRRPS
jgi:hypothetical protein